MDPIEQFIQMLMGGGMSNFNSKGVEQPRDLGWAKDLANYQQDLGQMASDPIFAGLSYGNDPLAFEPTVEREVLDVYNPLQPYLNLPADSTDPGAAIAKMIAEGAGPTEAVDAIGADWSDDVRQNWYPQAQEWFTGNDQFQQQIAGAQFDDATGEYYKETSTPSEAAQAYTDIGLPTPNDQWQLDDFGALGNTPRYSGQGAATGTRAAADRASQRQIEMQDVVDRLRAQQEAVGQQNEYQAAAVPRNQPDRDQAAVVAPAAAVPEVLGEDVSGMYTSGVDQSTANQAPYDVDIDNRNNDLRGAVVQGLGGRVSDREDRMSGLYGVAEEDRPGFQGTFAGLAKQIEDANLKLREGRKTAANARYNANAQEKYASTRANLRQERGYSPLRAALIERLGIAGGRTR